MIKDRTTLNIALAAIAAVFVYLFSPPFVMYAEFKLAPGPRVDDAMMSFYAPAEWLAVHFSPYRKVIKYLMRHGPEHWGT